MKKQQVKVGGTYTAKITDKVVPVRIDAENARGGWDATNLQTNRKCRIKSAQKLRGEIKVPNAIKDANADGSAAPTEKPKGGKKKLTAAGRKALVAQHKADQENARLRDEREASPDGMTASERAMATSAKDTDQAPLDTTPAPDALRVEAVYDKKDQKWDATIREGKTEHVALEERFDSDEKAKASGERWLTKYRKATDANRRKMLGWKAASGGEAAEGKQTPKRSKAAPKERKPKKLSLIDAAAQVLAESKEPMNVKQIVEQVIANKLWSTSAPTPHATLYSAILREIQKKGAEARFNKVERGQFTLAKGA